jgi:hypothetical protein
MAKPPDYENRGFKTNKKINPFISLTGINKIGFNYFQLLYCYQKHLLQV